MCVCVSDFLIGDVAYNETNYFKVCVIQIFKHFCQYLALIWNNPCAWDGLVPIIDGFKSRFWIYNWDFFASSCKKEFTVYFRSTYWELIVNNDTRIHDDVFISVYYMSHNDNHKSWTKQHYSRFFCRDMPINGIKGNHTHSFEVKYIGNSYGFVVFMQNMCLKGTIKTGQFIISFFFWQCI